MLSIRSKLGMIAVALTAGCASVSTVGTREPSSLDGSIARDIRKLNSGFWVPTRVRAAEQLGASQDPRAVEALAEHLATYANLEVCMKITGILAEKRDVSAVPALLRALDGQRWEIVQMCAWILGLTGDLRAVDPLIDVLSGRRAKTRVAAAWALGKLGDDSSVPHLVRALENESWPVRWAAAWSLGELGAPQALDPLLSALSRECRTVDRIETFYVGTGGDMTPRFLEPDFLYSNNHRTLLIALWRVVASGDADVKDSFRGKLTDLGSEHVASAYEILIRLGDRRDEPVLIEALDRHGTVIMAQDFLACGNHRLELAAEHWISDSRLKRALHDVVEGFFAGIANTGLVLMHHATGGWMQQDPASFLRGVREKRQHQRFKRPTGCATAPSWGEMM